MKKIDAIIRKSKFSHVKKALIDAKVDNFSYWLVRNVGEASETRVYRGVEYETSALERIHLSFISNEKPEVLVALITNAGITGEKGDARIYISDIKEAYQLKTSGDKDQALKL